jgi:hypothetical protein
MELLIGLMKRNLLVEMDFVGVQTVNLLPIGKLMLVPSRSFT